jgi:hypothetical protein
MPFRGEAEIHLGTHVGCPSSLQARFQRPSKLHAEIEREHDRRLPPVGLKKAYCSGGDVADGAPVGL